MSNCEVDFIVIYVEFAWVQHFLNPHKKLGPPGVKGLVVVEIHAQWCSNEMQLIKLEIAQQVMLQFE